MEQSKIKNFTDLVAWQEAHSLALSIYQATKAFPKDELYGPVNQMRRSVVSIASNIAEGFGRKTNADKRHFYNIAGGSLAEIQSQLFLARDLGYLNKDSHVSLNE
ncbi:MAG: four helix bundle protein [Patescibacteria group bacterium]